MSKRVVVTEDLLELLSLLYRYKYLRTSFIRDLLGAGKRGLIYQLKRRREQGFVFKPREQLRGYNNLYSPRIHSITKKGEKLLHDYGKHPVKATRLHRGRGDAPVKNFAHAMMICDTLASIEIGCKAHGLEFITWTEILNRTEVEDPMRLPFSFTYQGKVVYGKLVPDGLFGIRYPDNKVSFFALECEHYSPLNVKDLKRASFLKKTLGYHDILKQKTYQQLGISNLHVLFVFPTTTRTNHAVELVEQLFGTYGKYLMHAVPVQEELLKAPPPFPDLLTSEWNRAGLPAVPLYEQRDSM